MEVRCKHCNLRLTGDAPGYLHAEGQQRGKMRCAVDPYGFNGEPENSVCTTACLGSTGARPKKVYSLPADHEIVRVEGARHFCACGAWMWDGDLPAHIKHAAVQDQ